MGFVRDAVSSVFGTGDTTEAQMVNTDPSLLRGRVDNTFVQGQDLQKQLQQQALTGQGPLNDIFQNQLGQANNQAASLIASQRGVNPGMAARLAANASGQANQQALGQAAQNQLGAQQLAVQSNQGLLNSAQAGITGQNSANAGIAQANNQTNSQGVGGLFGAAGSIAAKGIGKTALGGALGFAEGGSVPFIPSYAGGGPICGQSHVHAYFNGGQAAKVPAMVSPGEVYIPPSKMNAVAKGADPIDAGQKIPGKAKVKGNSLKNDTVSKTLEEGGIVLPKSVMESKNPHWAAHKFVSEVMAKQGLSARRKRK